MKKKIATLLLVVSALVLSLFGLTACGADPTKLEAPQNVRIDASSMAVVWDKVENAEKYVIRIDDGTEYTISGTRYACTQFVSQSKSFTVEVSAMKGKKTSKSTVVSFSPLPKVTDLTLTENRLTWTPVVGATGYEMLVDGTPEELPMGVAEYTITETGRHTYKVRPIVTGDHSVYSLWSNDQTVTKLGTVDATKIKFDAQTAKLSWPAVSGATSYEVTVNSVVIAEDCTATSMDFDCPNGNFIVQIKAKSTAANTLVGDLSEGKEFKWLSPVTNIKVTDGILTWDEVLQADKYILEVGNKKHTLTTTSYDKLPRGTSLTIRLMPACNDEAFFSSWSAPHSFLLLEAPVLQWNSSLELDDGSAKSNLFWDSVANADGYSVRVTMPSGAEDTDTLPETQRSFAYDYLQTGTYTVEVKAMADPSNSSICDSPYSTAITVTRLPAPKAVQSGFITSNAAESSKGFDVSFEKVAQASGYRLYKEENAFTEVSATASQFRVTDVTEEGSTAEQTFNYKIQTLGSNTLQNNKVVLSSLKDNSLTFQIKVLATPQNPTMEGFNFTFGSIEGAQGYAVTAAGDIYDANSTTYDLGKVLEAGPADVRVCAKGNGSNILASNFSAPVKVVRLDRPYNIRIDEANASESVLKCAEIPNARSYNVVFDNDGQPMDLGAIANIRQYIKTTGTTVYMEAVSNQFGADDVYYMTSRASETKTFMKLETPTFGTTKFTNTQLIWNHPGNMNTAVYTPNYEVYNEIDNKYTGEKTGSSMNIEYLEGGVQYTFKVKAIGDGVNYINSEISESVQIYKIAATQITRDTVKHLYTWPAVARATEYAVYVDGVLQKSYAHEGGKTYEYKPMFEELKDYKVEVIAKGDGGNETIDSPSVLNKNYIKQQTQQLQKPDFSISYSHECVDNEGKVTVTITQASPYATGYYYTIGGVGAEGTTTFTKDLSTPGAHKVSVYALGGGFDEQGTYYLNSQATGGGSDVRYIITLLAAPNSSGMTREDFLFVWTAINNAPFGYKLEISTDNGATYTVVAENTTKTQYDFSSHITDGVVTVKFRVQANGNAASNVIAGEAEESQTWMLG